MMYSKVSEITKTGREEVKTRASVNDKSGVLLTELEVRNGWKEYREEL